MKKETEKTVTKAKPKTPKKTSSKKTDLQKKTKANLQGKASEKTSSTEVTPIKILGYNNLELNTYVFDNVKNPKAVVVIVHGMMEHAGRYKNFAKFLNDNGYIVIVNDLRGHGHTAPNKNRLGFGDEDIFQETLKDELNIINYASQKYKLPVYLLGHSYGSMLSQVLIQLTQNVQKCVISGTGNGDAILMKLASYLAHVLAPFKNEDSPGGKIEKLVIKGFEKGFDRGNWLSRDEKIFDEYNADEYCGGSFPFSFYKSLFYNMAKANDGIDKIGNKKIFFIVGGEDPVGSKSKDVAKLYNLYLKHNIDAKLKVYPGARHELLNETNKEEVYQDILDFFDK